MKKYICIIVALMLATSLCLTGCGCQHEWKDATCVAPKTCTLCGATEGETPDHIWVDATCLTPKTCSVCGTTEGETADHSWVKATCETPKTCSVCNATEGEALGHDMADPTYEAPATCKTCGYTEGETITPDFEKYGMNVINAEMDVEYDYITSCSDYEFKTTGKLVLSDYKTFTSDETREAMDGYEWHSVTVTITFSDDRAWNYGFGVMPCWDNYYTMGVWTEDETTNFSVTHNGIVYDQCLIQNGEVELSGWDADTQTNIYTCVYAWRVPVGFDGYLLGFIDHTTNCVVGQYAYEFLDSNALFFKFD